MIKMQAGFALNLLGDGTTSSFSFDITKAPVNFNVNGQNPTAAKFIDPVTGAFTNATLTGGHVVGMTFSAAPPAGTGTNVSVILMFDGI